MKTARTLIDNTDAKRYEFDLGDGARAFIEYKQLPEGLALTHTIVPPQFEGQGIAAELTAATLEAIRARGLRIVPQCSYVVRYIERHPEWQELVAASAEKTAESPEVH